MDFPGLLPTSGRLSSLYIPLQLLGTYLKMKIEKYCLILYEHVCRIISKSGLNEAYQCLLSIVKLVEKQYGQKKITPNMHLCLHICECALDYGPLYSFWCYSFERMNGLLGNINNPDTSIKFLIFTNLQVHYTVIIDILNRNCSKLFNITLSLMSYQRRVMKIN